MKATIDRKTYNTETSTNIARATNAFNGRNCHDWWETLYLSRKGNWFLHGEGGAMSKYANVYLNCASSGERIIPMTAEEALEWCEEHGAQDAIDKYFPDMVEEA